MRSFTRRETLSALGALALSPWLGARMLQAANGTETLVLVEKEAPAVSFYKLPTGEHLSSIPLPVQPHEIVMDAEQRFAYIAQYGVGKWGGPGIGGHSVFVINLKERRLERTLDLSPFNRLHGIRMDDAGRLYVLSESESMMIRFDNPATNPFPSQVIPVGGARSHYFVIRRDGSRAYITDTLSGMVISMNPHDPIDPPIKRFTGSGPEGCCLSPDEQSFYVANRRDNALILFDAATFKEKKRIQTRGEPVRLISLPSGQILLSNEQDRSLTLHHPETLAEERRLELPAAVPGLNLHPSGKQLLAAMDNNRLAIINLESWKMEHQFPTQAAPDTAVVMRS